MSIAALVSFANLCTANNTIALIMAGPIAKDIADRFKIDPAAAPAYWISSLASYRESSLRRPDVDGRRTRAYLPIEIMQYLYYPYLLGAGALLAIAFNYPRKYTLV